MRLLGGIFVGGAARRMGGRAKGLLPHPSGTTVVEHLAALLRAVGAEVTLVGADARYGEWPRVSDRPPGIGPLGGLCGLLAATDGAALALACDMPRITAADLEQLIAAKGDHLAAAPVRDGRFEPLCAIYDARALPIAEQRAARGERSLQGLLAELHARPVDLPPAHLDDWDTPEDLRRG